MKLFLQVIHDGNWGDLAGIGGVIISIVGFGFTLFGLARSKRVSQITAEATQKTAEAISDVRSRLLLQETALDLTALTNEIEEIKHFHRLGIWGAMPGRYSAIRRRLFAVKENCPFLTKAQKTSIQGVVQQFKLIEETVETALAQKQVPDNVALLNKVASEQSDKLTIVLMTINNTMRQQ